MKCLLIDDDQDDQEIFELTLKRIDDRAELQVANDGPEALQMLRSDSEKPDYIFLDMNMPKMDGIECLAEIKSIPGMDQCKIIMYSTTADESLIQRVSEMGADDFIVKPASPAALQTTLINIFSA